MENQISKNIFLPDEVLEIIFLHLDIKTVRLINKRWKAFSDLYSDKFLEANIDLLKFNTKIFKKLNPVKIKITSSNIYDKIPISFSDEEKRKFIKREYKILNSVKKGLNIIRKYSSLKTIHIELNLFDLILDKFKSYEYFHKGGIEVRHINNNTFSVFCIKNLLESKAKNFVITINYNFIDDIHRELLYESWFKNYLISVAYKYDTFIYNGSYNMFFNFNKELKTFIYRVGDLNFLREESNGWCIKEYIKTSKLKNYKLEHLYIYTDYLDPRFKDWCIIEEMIYYYYIDDKSKYNILFEDLDSESFTEEEIREKLKTKEKSYIRMFNSDVKSIEPYKLIICKKKKLN